MATLSKQDRQGARTPADLEQRYRFGKSFAEVMGIATDAQQAAQNAAAGVDGLDEKLDQTEIFNRLTNNGEAQGIYRDDDGEIYINASYIKTGQLIADIIKSGVIKSVDGKRVVIDLDTGNVTLTGTIRNEVVLSDGSVNYASIDSGHITVGQGEETGIYGATDIDLFGAGGSLSMAVSGDRVYVYGLTAPIDDEDAANKAYVDGRTADYIVSQGTDGAWTYRKWASGIAECWGNIVYSGDVTNKSSTSGRYYGEPVSATLPQGLFNNVPTVQVSPRFGIVNFEVVRRQWSYASSATTGDYVVYTEGSVSGADITTNNAPFIICVEAKGRWK